MSIKNSDQRMKFRKSIYQPEIQEEDDETESESEETQSTSVSTLTPEPEIQDTIQIEDDTSSNVASITPQPPKEASPRDHTPRPQKQFVPSFKPVVKHAKKKKRNNNINNHRHNKRNVSVEDLCLQVAMSE